MLYQESDLALRDDFNPDVIIFTLPSKGFYSADEIKILYMSECRKVMYEYDISTDKIRLIKIYPNEIIHILFVSDNISILVDDEYLLVNDKRTKYNYEKIIRYIGFCDIFHIVTIDEKIYLAINNRGFILPSRKMLGWHIAVVPGRHSYETDFIYLYRFSSKNKLIGHMTNMEPQGEKFYISKRMVKSDCKFDDIYVLENLFIVGDGELYRINPYCTNIKPKPKSAFSFYNFMLKTEYYEDVNPLIKQNVHIGTGLYTGFFNNVQFIKYSDDKLLHLD